MCSFDHINIYLATHSPTFNEPYPKAAKYQLIDVMCGISKDYKNSHHETLSWSLKTYSVALDATIMTRQENLNASMAFASKLLIVIKNIHLKEKVTHFQ